MPTTGHRLVEIGAVVAIVVFYVATQRWIADRWYFVLPAMAAGLAFLGWSLHRGGRQAADFGLSTQKLGMASAWCALLVGITLAAALAIRPPGTGVASTSFWLMLATYPAWGLAQQFLFQSVLHENLIRLGGAPWWTVLATTCAFTAVHYPSRRLLIVGVIGGLALSAIYRASRNLVPVGIAHGICGAIVYHIAFGEDLVVRFLGN